MTNKIYLYMIMFILLIIPVLGVNFTTSDILLGYTFESRSGDIIHDYTTFHNATNVGATLLTSGCILGECYNYTKTGDHAGDYMTIPAGAIPSGTNELTIVAWYKNICETSWQTIIGKENYLQISPEQNELLYKSRYMFKNNTKSIKEDSGDAFCTPTGWEMLTVTINTTNGQMKIYKNKTLINTTTGDTFVGKDSDIMHIGSLFDGVSPSQTFSGGIDEVFIINKSISEFDVNTTYDNYIGGLNVISTAQGSLYKFVFDTRSPLNDTPITDTRLLTYSLSNINGTANCSYYVGGTHIINETLLSNGVHNFSFNSSHWSQHHNEVNVTCKDGTGYFGGESKFLYVDTINPVIIDLNYSVLGTHYNLNNSKIGTDTLTINISVNDTNLYYFSDNFSIIGAGTRIQWNITLNTSKPRHVFDKVVTLTSVNEGWYEVNVTLKDWYKETFLHQVSELAYTYIDRPQTGDDYNQTKYANDQVDYNITFTENNTVNTSIEILRYVSVGETLISFSNLANLTDLQINISDTNILSETGNASRHRTIRDFSSTLNDIIPACNCTGCYILDNGNCSIPIYMSSKNESRINLNNLYVGYNLTEVRVEIFNELNKTLITNANISVEFISDIYTTNYTSNTGNDTVELVYSTYTIRYSAIGFHERFYEYIYTPISNPLIQLYLLNDTSATEVTATVYDEIGKELPGVTIEYLAYNPSSGQFEVAGSGITNFEGQTKLYLRLNDEYYIFKLYYPSGTLKQTTPKTYIYSNTITFQIDTGGVGDDLHFQIEGIYSLLTFNNITNTFIWDYSDTHTLGDSYCLYNYRQTDFGNPTHNFSCLTASSGQISLGVTPTNGSVYLAKAYVLIDSDKYFLDQLHANFQGVNPFHTGTSATMVLFIIWIISITFAFINRKLTIAPIATPLAGMLVNYMFKLNIDPSIPVALTFIGLILAVLINRE